MADSPLIRAHPWLRLEIPPRARIGEPVSMTLRVENRGGESLELYLRGRTIAFDMIVTDRNGSTVWRRLRDAVIPAVIRIEVLPPGASLELRDTWDQLSDSGELVEPGSYLVRGELLTDENPLVTPLETLEIMPR